MEEDAWKIEHNVLVGEVGNLLLLFQEEQSFLSEEGELAHNGEGDHHH